MRLEIPGETSSLMNLPQLSFQAQTKGERESSTGICFVFLSFLSSFLFPPPPLPIMKPQARWGVPLLVVCQYSLSMFFHLKLSKKSGAAGNMHNESSPGSRKGPFFAFEIHFKLS